jgi:hypothetical protein
VLWVNPPSALVYTSQQETTSHFSPDSLCQTAQVWSIIASTWGRSIVTAVKYYSPYIVQSLGPWCVLTDCRPCVDAYDKLCHGEFSAGPRVYTFLSTVSRYQVPVCHVTGTAILPSDHSSRSAPDLTVKFVPSSHSLWTLLSTACLYLTFYAVPQSYHWQRDLHGWQYSQSALTWGELVHTFVKIHSHPAMQQA